MKKDMNSGAPDWSNILLARLNQLDSQVKAFMQAASLDLEDVHNRIETLFQLLDKEGDGSRRVEGSGEGDKEDTLSLTPSHPLSSDNEVKDLLRELIQEVKGLKGLKSQEEVVTSKTTDSLTNTPKKRGRPRKNSSTTLASHTVQEVVSEAVGEQPVVDTAPQSFYAWEGTFPDPREYKAVE